MCPSLRAYGNGNGKFGILEHIGKLQNWLKR